MPYCQRRQRAKPSHEPRRPEMTADRCICCYWHGTSHLLTPHTHNKPSHLPPVNPALPQHKVLCSQLALSPGLKSLQILMAIELLLFARLQMPKRHGLWQIITFAALPGLNSDWAQQDRVCYFTKRGRRSTPVYASNNGKKTSSPRERIMNKPDSALGMKDTRPNVPPMPGMRIQCALRFWQPVAMRYMLSPNLPKIEISLCVLSWLIQWV
ncbi:uncharacterized protein BO95DRAFT_254955 [Aspergillus brunneoviolaceus CBS 621.78]|uniref:Uncharacterized protein n=1 Tax=Aspergillus brunneoviolaceus CBS 621.78 TaxID=1450534 RepID=A0ACD1FY90_9EURO|nr:hypothetical protein BO95DRAFT_254955 [Aspergillus brunneoviolaceus CBS 621.78]RAH41929.1 hypothetical protein BO95DRAFT_254955 [Aspergillus brunneoviolaceus CBS 621.78]